MAIRDFPQRYMIVTATCCGWRWRRCCVVIVVILVVQFAERVFYRQAVFMEVIVFISEVCVGWLYVAHLCFGAGLDDPHPLAFFSFV